MMMKKRETRSEEEAGKGEANQMHPRITHNESDGMQLIDDAPHVIPILLAGRPSSIPGDCTSLVGKQWTQVSAGDATGIRSAVCVDPGGREGCTGTRDHQRLLFPCC